jgi:quinohemoprotein ethanol dehydrogenase
MKFSHSRNRRFDARFVLFTLIAIAGCDGPVTPEMSKVNGLRLEQPNKEPGNWMTHGRTYSEQRYSPLDQVSDQTVAGLGLEWYTELDTDRGIEATPIVVDGVMYVTGGWSIVYAIDARTGQVIWRFDPKVPGSWAAYACCDVVNRGVAAWQGNVFVGTLDGRLIALDARTGDRVWEVQTTDRDQPYTITGAPRVIKGKVIIGNSGADYGVRGYVSAYESTSGRLAWRFYTVPGDPSKPFESDAMKMAAETWTGDWWRSGGGGTVWNAMAYDSELDLLYIGVGNGTPWSQRQRSPEGGDNLFLSSIVALDPDDGEYVWHYQTTPGESWNYSATESIVLTTVTVDDKRRRVLIQAPKNGFFYVLDRITGELISAEPYATVNWASHIDLETGRPVEFPHARYGAEGRVIIPGASGGHSWYPMSYSPRTGLAYVPAHDVPNTYRLDDGYRFARGFQNTGIEEGVVDFSALDPRGEKAKVRFGVHLIAWDPEQQKEAWRVSQGTLGGGVLSTAGNLVFQGTGSGQFNAYAADTGEVLWTYEAGTSIMPGPVSYSIGDEQYVTVMAGRGGGSGLVGGPMGRPWGDIRNVNRVLTFKLGGKATLPPPGKLERVLDPPPATADAETVALGKGLYDHYCYGCHGLGLEGGGVLPDLRYADREVHAAWVNIVIEGALENKGMRSFADAFDPQDALAIQAYVVERAHALKAESN